MVRVSVSVVVGVRERVMVRVLKGLRLWLGIEKR